MALASSSAVSHCICIPLRLCDTWIPPPGHGTHSLLFGLSPASVYLSTSVCVVNAMQAPAKSLCCLAQVAFPLWTSFCKTLLGHWAEGRYLIFPSGPESETHQATHPHPMCLLPTDFSGQPTIVWLFVGDGKKAGT